MGLLSSYPRTSTQITGFFFSSYHKSFNQNHWMLPFFVPQSFNTNYWTLPFFIPQNFNTNHWTLPFFIPQNFKTNKLDASFLHATELQHKSLDVSSLYKIWLPSSVSWPFPYVHLKTEFCRASLHLVKAEIPYTVGTWETHLSFF